MPARNPRVATPRTQQKRPGDLTGVNNQKLASEAVKAKANEEEAAREAIENEKAVKRATTVDYTGDSSESKLTVEVAEQVSVRPKTEVIMVNYPIEQMTFGREVIDPGVFDEEQGRWVKAPRLGDLTSYSFEEGVRYEVSSDMADHLKELGYVYNF